MDYAAFSGLIPFVFLVSFGMTAFVIALVVLPLYGLFLYSARRFCKDHTITLAIKSLKFASASAVAYFTCLVLSALHVVPVAAMLVGFIVLLVIISQTARELLAAGFGYFIPSFSASVLINETEIVNSNRVVLLGGLRLPRYSVVGFVKVKAMPEKLEDICKLRDALFGLYDAKVPTGYCVGFGEKFSLYFFTYAESLFQRKAIMIALERLTILKETISSRLPELNIEIVQEENVIRDLISNLAKRTRIHGLKEVVKTFRDQHRWEVGGIRIEGAPAYKEERFSSFVETLLNLKIPALYVVTAQPVTGFQLFLAKHEYRNRLREGVGTEGLPAEPNRISLRRRKLLAVKDLRLFKVAANIWLGAETREELKTALRTVKSVVKAEFCSEWTNTNVKEIRGLHFSMALDQLQLFRPKGKSTILTASEAAIYIRLPSSNTPGVESKVTTHLTVPQGTRESLEASSLCEATAVQRVKIGKTLDLVSNTITSDAILDTSDFVNNIGVFGKEAGLTSCLIAVSAAHAGFNYVVLDYHGLYRTIIYSFPSGRVLRFGFDFTLDPFETEGMEASDYLELLFTAFHQAYRIPYSLLQPFLEVTLPVYEQAENRRITAAEIVGHINELLESPHHKAHQHELVNLREMLGHLLYGRTLEAVSAPPSLPISKFLQGLTVVELNRFTSHEFRNFIQALFLIKTFAKLVTTKNRAEHTVILVDAIEHLFPDRNVLPLYSRELHLQYRLEELRKLGVNLHLSTAFPLEVDPVIVKWTRTKIFHEAFGRDPGFFSLNEVQRTFATRMQPPEALLSKWSGEMVPIVVDRPQWIFKAQPTDEEAEACLLRLGYPIREIQEEMEAKVSKDDLELDFGKDASSAYTLLKDLRDYENVTKLALVLTLANLPAEEARPLASLLERLGYMKEEKRHGGMPVLRLTMRGLKAVKQWEEKHPSLENLPPPERVDKEEGKEESKDE